MGINYVIIREVVADVVDNETPGDSPPQNSVTILNPGTYPVADFKVPSGVDVLLELWGGGGGGGGGTAAMGGGGGGGGAYLMASVPALTWAAVSHIGLNVGGSAGAPSSGGVAGGNATLHDGATPIVLAGGGGGGALGGGMFASGGAVSIDPACTEIKSIPGQDATSSVDAVGTAGGKCYGPGGAAGGAGGNATAGADGIGAGCGGGGGSGAPGGGPHMGGNGMPCKARVTWPA